MCIFQGLENYIQTLPSEDELTALKNRCRAKEDECGRLNMKITSLTLKLEKSENEVKGLLDSRDSSEIQVRRICTGFGATKQSSKDYFFHLFSSKKFA